MVAAFDYCLHGRGGAAPSIDTAMHGLVDADARRPPPPRLRDRARDRRRRRGADPPLLRRPGRLGRRGAGPGSSSASTSPRSARDQPEAIGAILGGHGITAWGDTSDDVRGALARDHPDRRAVHRRARAAGAVRAGRRRATSRCPTAERRARAAALLPLIRGLASTDRPQVGHYTDSDVVLDFLGAGRASAAGRARARRAPTTSCGPRSGRWSSTCRRPPTLDDVVARLRELHAAYRDGLRAPTTSATRRRTARRCAAPTRRSCSSRASGCSSFGANKQTARVAGEFYVNAINVMRGAEALSTYAPDRRGGEVPHRVLGARGGQARAACRSRSRSRPGSRS